MSAPWSPLSPAEWRSLSLLRSYGEMKTMQIHGGAHGFSYEVVRLAVARLRRDGYVERSRWSADDRAVWRLTQRGASTR